MRVLIVTNLYPTPSAPTKGPFVKKQMDGLRGIGVDLHLLHVDRAGRGRRAYRGLRRLVRRAVRDVAPDVVHVMYGGVTADIVTRAVKDRPVIVTFYGSDLLGLRGDVPVLKRAAARYGVIASRRAARRARAVIVQARVLADALPRRIDRSRVWVIPDGVDFALFAPKDRDECQRALGWDPSVRHVLFPSARSRPEKRFQLAQSAVAQLATLGVVAELHDLDGVPHERVPVWLNAANAVLLTSTHEGSPNAVKEALACNVRVVSVDVGDVRERFEAMDGCDLGKPDSADLAEKLSLALSERERPRTRERMPDLSLERTAERLLRIYTSLVQSG